MRLYQITPPTTPPVSLAEMKEHLRVEDSDEDELIEAITAACVEKIDGFAGIGRALVDQTWEARFDSFCAGPIELPLPPLIAVESVKYYDDNNALQTFSAAKYQVIGAGSYYKANITLNNGEAWPTSYSRGEAVAVRFRAGYVDRSGSPAVGEVPSRLIAAIKLMAGTLYAQRETLVVGTIAAEIPGYVESLIDKYRVYSF